MRAIQPAESVGIASRDCLYPQLTQRELMAVVQSLNEIGDRWTRAVLLVAAGGLIDAWMAVTS